MNYIKWMKGKARGLSKRHGVKIPAMSKLAKSKRNLERKLR